MSGDTDASDAGGVQATDVCWIGGAASTAIVHVGEQVGALVVAFPVCFAQRAARRTYPFRAHSASRRARIATGATVFGIAPPVVRVEEIRAVAAAVGAPLAGALSSSTGRPGLAGNSATAAVLGIVVRVRAGVQSFAVDCVRRAPQAAPLPTYVGSSVSADAAAVAAVLRVGLQIHADQSARGLASRASTGALAEPGHACRGCRTLVSTIAAVRRIVLQIRADRPRWAPAHVRRLGALTAAGDTSGSVLAAMPAPAAVVVVALQVDAALAAIG